VVPGATHFSVISPVSKLLAQKIVADDGPTPAITVSADELAAAMGNPPR
jgi:hypothetical protein